MQRENLRWKPAHIPECTFGKQIPKLSKIYAQAVHFSARMITNTHIRTVGVATIRSFSVLQHSGLSRWISIIYGKTRSMRPTTLLSLRNGVKRVCTRCSKIILNGVYPVSVRGGRRSPPSFAKGATNHFSIRRLRERRQSGLLKWEQTAGGLIRFRPSFRIT